MLLAAATHGSADAAACRPQVVTAGVASPAPSRCVVVHAARRSSAQARFDQTSRVVVRASVRRNGRRAGVLLKLPTNRVAVAVTTGGRLTLQRGGRRLGRRTIAVATRRWTTVTLTFDARAGRVALRSGRSTATALLGGLVPECGVDLRARRAAASIARVLVQRTADPALATAPVPPTPPAGTPVAIATPAPTVTAPQTTTPCCVTSTQDYAGAHGRFFSPTSVWNTQIADDAPVDPMSAAWVTELQRQLTLGDPWINTTKWSSPLYTVPADQPTVKVTLDTSYAVLQNAWLAVPLPVDARPAGGTDGHLVVYQPSTDTMWEFWAMHGRRLARALGRPDRPRSRRTPATSPAPRPPGAPRRRACRCSAA